MTLTPPPGKAGPPTRLIRIVFSGAMLAGLLFLAACSNAGDPQATAVPGATAEAPTTADAPEQSSSGECEAVEGRPGGCRWLATDNSLIMRVEGYLAEPGQVFVEYWNEDAGRFRTQPVDTGDGAYAIDVAKLRADTEYEFEVFESHPEEGVAVPVAGGRFKTGPLPRALQRAKTTVVEGASSSEVTFMDYNVVEFGEEPPFDGFVAVDAAGEIVWYTETPDTTTAMGLKPNGNIVYLEWGFGMKEITPTGELVASVQSPCGPMPSFHHEVEAMPGDRIMTLAYTLADPFDDPARLQAADAIWIWDQASASVTEAWSLLDFEDPKVNRTPTSDTTEEDLMWRGCEGSEQPQDWSHSNSAKLAPDGSVIFSSRHLNQVHSISPDFTGVNWRLGGTGSDFSFPDPADRFYHQHTAYQLDNGNILLFDNGNTRPESEGGEYSRALELALDLEAGTATKVWEYVPEPGLYSDCCSSVERLANGNTLIVFGANRQEDVCCRTHTIVEAGPDQETVWKVEVAAPGQNVVYRVYAADSILGEQRVP